MAPRPPGRAQEWGQEWRQKKGKEKPRSVDRGLSLRWRHGDSNPEPPACKAGALPIAPCPRIEPQPVYQNGCGPDYPTSSVALLQTAFSFSESCHRLYAKTPAAAAAAISNLFTVISLQLPAGGGSVGVPGLEPGTSSLSAKRSNRLSYTPRCLIGPRYDFTADTRQSSNRRSRHDEAGC